jgi:hypothetical protein
MQQTTKTSKNIYTKFHYFKKMKRISQKLLRLKYAKKRQRFATLPVFLIQLCYNCIICMKLYFYDETSTSLYILSKNHYINFICLSLQKRCKSTTFFQTLNTSYSQFILYYFFYKLCLLD